MGRSGHSPTPGEAELARPTLAAKDHGSYRQHMPDLEPLMSDEHDDDEPVSADTPNRVSVVAGSRVEAGLFADAAVVEVIGDTVQISFLTQSRVVNGVVWPDGPSQPTRVGLSRAVEETARIRISAAAANDLAMNLLLEIVQHLDLEAEAFERNVSTVRAVIQAQNIEEGAGDHE